MAWGSTPSGDGNGPVSRGSAWGSSPAASTTSAPSNYKPPSSGGFFGFKLPKFGLSELAAMPLQIAGGLGSMAEGLLPGGRPAGELPSMFAKGAAASTLGTFGRIGNALTLGKVTSTDDIKASIGGWLGSSDEQKAQLGEVAGGNYQGGLLPGLLTDVGNIALVGQGAGKLAALGEAGKVGAASLAEKLALQGGYSKADIASKLSLFEDATPAARAASHIPLVRRLVPGAADLAGGGTKLTQAARAAYGAKGLATDTAAAASRTKLLDILHGIGHPYQTAFHDVLRPLTKGATSSILAKTAGEEFPIIHADDLDPQAHTQVGPSGEELPGTSRPVSAEEFQNIARRGQSRLDKMAEQGGDPVALDDNLQTLTQTAYDATRTQGGGVTIDAATGEVITPTEGLATTIKRPGNTTLEIAGNASPEEFARGMENARTQFAEELKLKDAALGVFHGDRGTIEFDPVAVVGDKLAAEEISAASRSLGGAYDFATGNGHFAPHVVDEAGAPLRNIGSELGPQAGPAEVAMLHGYDQAIPELAQKIADRLPEGAQKKLQWVEHKIEQHQWTQVRRERLRFFEVARFQMLRSPAMTEGRAAAQALVDNKIVADWTKASGMVTEHIMAALDGRTFIAAAAAEGMPPEFLTHLEKVLAQSDIIPKEAFDTIPDLAERLATASELFKGMEAERTAELLASPRLGNRGLENVGATTPEMSARQAKDYTQIRSEWKRITGQQPLVEKEALAAAAEVLKKTDQVGALSRKADIASEQARAEAAKVLDQTAPKSLSGPERTVTIGRHVQAVIDEGRSLLDPHTGQRVVAAKFATEADHLDPLVRVTARTGKVGEYERYAVATVGDEMPLDTFVADPMKAMEDFLLSHASAVAHPDVKIATFVDGDKVHIQLQQTTLRGKYLTGGQAHILGMARGMERVHDMVGNDWHPPTDSVSMAAAAWHVPEIMKPSGQFNRWLKGNEATLEGVIEAATKAGIEPRSSTADMLAFNDMFMRFGLVVKKNGRVKSLDKFYAKLATEARTTTTGLPGGTRFQTYLNMPLNKETLRAAREYLGPEAQESADWYYTQNKVVHDITGDRKVPIFNRRTGKVEEWDASELVFSLAAVTSKNSGPLGNAVNSFSALSNYVNYTEMAGWIDHFAKNIAEYTDEVATAARTGKRTSVNAAFTANELYTRLAGPGVVAHMTEVRHDVMEVLSGRSVADFDNEYLRTRLPEGTKARKVREALTPEAAAKRYSSKNVKVDPADLSEWDVMEMAGSTGYAKIRSFYENLKSPETSMGVTLDRVMAELIGLNGGNWNAKGAYAAAAKMTRDLADQWSVAEYGETGRIKPHEVQAMLWAFSKKQVNENDLGRLNGAVGDALDAIDAGTFGQADNPVRAYLESDIKFGEAQPRGGAPTARKVRVRKGEGDVQAIEPTEETHFHKFAGTDQKKLAEQVGEAVYEKGRAKNWAAIEKEVLASLERGDTAGAKRRLEGWRGSEARRYNNDPQGFDITTDIGPNAHVQRRVVNDLRLNGWLPMSERDKALRASDEAANAWLGDAVFQKFSDAQVNGATYTKTSTGRLTMAFFKTADATTLVHEGAHVLRQFLDDSEIATLERGLGGKVGEVAFEEAWAEAFTSYLNRAPVGPGQVGLTPLFARVKEALATIWQGVTGKIVDTIDPGTASIIERYLSPSEESLAHAPDLPEFKLDLKGKTSEQIAANLPPRGGETQSASLRRGYLAGKAATRQLMYEDKQKRILANRAVIMKSRDELARAITERSLPRVQAMDRSTLKNARRADRLARELDASSPISQYPAVWQPMLQGIRDFQKLGVNDPIVAQALSKLPATFSELVDFATTRGFQPTHVASLSEADVRALVHSPAKLGRRGEIAGEVEAGTRKKRTSANYRTITLDALGAAQVQVVWERETNRLIDLIEQGVARPYQRDTPGWVAWDDTRGFLATGEHVNRPDPKLMVPEAVAKSIRNMSGNYQHHVFDTIGKSKIINGWKALVLTWAPGHYVTNVMGNIIFAATQGVKLEDYAQALVQMRTGAPEALPFGRVAEFLEKRGLGKNQGTYDMAELLGSGAYSEFEEITGNYQTGAQRGLVRPPKLPSVRSVVGEAGGKVEAAQATGRLTKAKFLHVQDRLNNFNGAIDRLGRAATYIAGRRQGVSDEIAMMRSYEGMGDFGNLSPFERAVATTVIPFYAFQKAVLKIVSKYPLDHPIGAALGIQMAELNQTLLNPDLPEYYGGLLHVPGTDLKLNIKSINPFGDALGLLTPEGLAQAMNPALKAVAMNAFHGSDGYVESYKVDQFGNTVPDTSLASDFSQLLTRSAEGNLLGSTAGIGPGGSGRGAVGGLGQFLGATTYTDAQMEKYRERFRRSRDRATPGKMFPTWMYEKGQTPPKQVTSTRSG